MNRGQEVTAKLENLKKAVNELTPLLSAERVEFEMIRGDIESLELVKKRLMQERQTIEESNRSASQTSEKIVETANEKANEILVAARERNVESMQLLEKVKEFVKGMDKKQYKELEAKAMANVGN